MEDVFFLNFGEHFIINTNVKILAFVVFTSDTRYVWSLAAYHAEITTTMNEPIYVDYLVLLWN